MWECEAEASSTFTSSALAEGQYERVGTGLGRGKQHHQRHLGQITAFAPKGWVRGTDEIFAAAYKGKQILLL
jgi:hypothetical protein